LFFSFLSETLFSINNCIFLQSRMKCSFSSTTLYLSLYCSQQSCLFSNTDGIVLETFVKNNVEISRFKKSNFRDLKSRNSRVKRSKFPRVKKSKFRELKKSKFLQLKVEIWRIKRVKISMLKVKISRLKKVKICRFKKSKFKV